MNALSVKIYGSGMHEMSGLSAAFGPQLMSAISRALYTFMVLLSFFAFDCAGSGISDGNYISYGYNEKNDLRMVVEYLYCIKLIPRIGIWGRCMGGASTLMFLHEATKFGFFTVHVKASAFATLLLYYCHATKRLLCPTGMLTRSCSTSLVSWNAQMESALFKRKKNSRPVTDEMLEIYSINGEDARGQEPSTVRHAAKKFTKTPNSTIVVRGIQYCFSAVLLAHNRKLEGSNI
uniref:Uncharacterized protein AlNc14C534G12076 n=1 Tax=Albugo laibachii Nc14 TaxID=890382 RepID=F0X0Y8_9STRA|nr:hypothetical protein ALNC14_135780 [Albugo laibachii Nc14]|eukprot:CCA27434.1 hypothetical protein ALNC14_135780 [Albugo laibachii Nc14]